MLQSPRLKDRVKTIGVYQSLSKNALFEHKFIQNIKKLYKHASKFDNQQQFTDILEAAMVSTPEGFTNKITRCPMTPTPVNNPSSIKSLCIFTNILDVKRRTSICRVVTSKSKRKAIKAGTTPWEFKPKQKLNLKINDQIKKYLYNWIMNYPKVLRSPIFKYCLKVNIDGHTKPQIFP